MTQEQLTALAEEVKTKALNDIKVAVFDLNSAKTKLEAEYKELTDKITVHIQEITNREAETK